MPESLPLLAVEGNALIRTKPCQILRDYFEPTPKDDSARFGWCFQGVDNKRQQIDQHSRKQKQTADHNE